MSYTTIKEIAELIAALTANANKTYYTHAAIRGYILMLQSEQDKIDNPRPVRRVHTPVPTITKPRRIRNAVRIIVDPLLPTRITETSTVYVNNNKMSTTIKYCRRNATKAEIVDILAKVSLAFPGKKVKVYNTTRGDARYYNGTCVNIQK